MATKLKSKQIDSLPYFDVIHTEDTDYSALSLGNKFSIEAGDNITIEDNSDGSGIKISSTASGDGSSSGSGTIHETTYSELYARMTSGELTPGDYYKFSYKFSLEAAGYSTDVCQSAGHDFYMVAHAVSTSNLSDKVDCYAIENDTYFTDTMKKLLEQSDIRVVWIHEAGAIIIYLKDPKQNETNFDNFNLLMKYNDNYYYTFNSLDTPQTDARATSWCFYNEVKILLETPPSCIISGMYNKIIECTNVYLQDSAAVTMFECSQITGNSPGTVNIGFNSSGIDLGTGNANIEIGSNCSSITFYSDSNNAAGQQTNITIGKGCYDISFQAQYTKNVIIEDGCHHIKIGAEGTGSESNYLQNLHFYAGVNVFSENVLTRGNDFGTHIHNDSDVIHMASSHVESALPVASFEEHGSDSTYPANTITFQRGQRTYDVWAASSDVTYSIEIPYGTNTDHYLLLDNQDTARNHTITLNITGPATIRGNEVITVPASTCIEVSFIYHSTSDTLYIIQSNSF